MIDVHQMGGFNMTDGQARVLMLLLVLGFLEAVVHPGIRAFFSTVYANISGNVGVGSK